VIASQTSISEKSRRNDVAPHVNAVTQPDPARSPRVIWQTKSPGPQSREGSNWLFRRTISELAAEGEFRWAVIEAEYRDRLAKIVRAA